MRNIREELEQEGNEFVLQRVREALMLVEYKLAQMTVSYH